MMRLRQYAYIFLLSLLVLTGCEDTNVLMLTEAGKDAVQAVTLSEQQVEQLAGKTAAYSDRKHRPAPPGSGYAERLARLTEGHRRKNGDTFNYRVYISSEVNAFALADGSIRVYSGLMDLMNDGELRFVLAHEMGHVVKDHSEKQMKLALAGKAVRKGLASQENIVGDLARSGLIGGLLERLINAQFSQAEEMEADEFSLRFLQKNGYDPAGAVSALEKLAGSGKAITLLSSHPEPGARARHLSELLQNPQQETEPGIMQTLLGLLTEVINLLKALVAGLLTLIAG